MLSGTDKTRRSGVHRERRSTIRRHLNERGHLPCRLLSRTRGTAEPHPAHRVLQGDRMMRGMKGAIRVPRRTGAAVTAIIAAAAGLSMERSAYFLELQNV